MPQTSKPVPFSKFAAPQSMPLAPFYGMLEGSGSSAADSSPAAAPALTLTGGAAWATVTGVGPVVRLGGTGQYLAAPDAPALRAPSTAVTLFAAVTPAAVGSSGDLLYAGKIYATYGTSYGLWNKVWNGNGDTIAKVNVQTASGVVELTSGAGVCGIANGTAYILALTWVSGGAVTLRVYDYLTGALVSSATGTTTASGTIAYDAGPFSVGKRDVQYTQGDFGFAAVVPDVALTAAQQDAFAANPWNGFTAPASQVLSTVPAGSLPGVPGAPVTFTLASEQHPAAPITVTPVFGAGLTGSFNPATVSLSDTVRSATTVPTLATSATGSGTIGCTNSGGLTNPAGAPYNSA